jgi:hypothetical protein
MCCGTDMEKRIMFWCIQNKLAFQHKTEDFTCNLKKFISDIVSHCNLHNLDLLLNVLNISSAVTFQSENDSIELTQQDDQNKRKLFTKWPDKIIKQEMNF